mmetsp:Transcript_2085/g.4861  ORF Transcript_2085/g.4861 Transcript_2085/m.4861 type:complete len:234 (+) Transcript_2085:1732-2433(+)
MCSRDFFMMFWGVLVLQSGSITMSAPLVSSMYFPSSVRTSTDMRRRSEVKSKTASCSYDTTLPRSRTLALSMSRDSSSNLFATAACTSEISSGLALLYSSSPAVAPSFRCGMTSLQSANSRRKSYMYVYSGSPSLYLSSCSSSWPSIGSRNFSPLTEQCLNTIRFCVNVPVLSQNTYSIWPSSALRAEAWFFIGPASSVSILQSQIIKKRCANVASSIETTSDRGMKALRRTR